eukprot:10024278-Alexandrium_andersonii.AAC.1
MVLVLPLERCALVEQEVFVWEGGGQPLQKMRKQQTRRHFYEEALATGRHADSHGGRTAAHTPAHP